MFYQQIKDIYATSIDYDPSDEMTLAFYKEVQKILEHLNSIKGLDKHINRLIFKNKRNP